MALKLTMIPPGRRLGALAVQAALFAFGSTLACAQDVLKFSHQGIERTAILHRPEAAPAGPLPLVMVLHGLGDTAENVRRWSRFDVTAGREKFATVYPDAVEKRWSYGRPVTQPMPTVGTETVDDVGFLRLLIDDLTARKVADPARVYVTGMSRGGLMAFTMACALADRIAAIAPVVTGMTDHQREDCRPARPTPLMAIAGTNDYTQAYDGWLMPNGRLLSIPETMDFWSTQHGCTQQKQRLLPHRDVTDHTRIMLVEWTACRSGAQLRLYRVMGGGHQMPSLGVPADERSVQSFGLRNRDIETADEVWAYFKGLAR